MSTSARSRVTRPSVTMASNDGRKARIFSAASTISITIGRSSDSRRIFAVCIRLWAPKPMKPFHTVAPARPCLRAASTMAS